MEEYSIFDEVDNEDIFDMLENRLQQAEENLINGKTEEALDDLKQINMFVEELRTRFLIS